MQHSFYRTAVCGSHWQGPGVTLLSGTWEGLLQMVHFTSFSFECPLQQPYLPVVQPELSLQICLDLAAALEEPHGFEFELFTVFLGGMCGLVVWDLLGII
jgi:hypothetical protein